MSERSIWFFTCNVDVRDILHKQSQKEIYERQDRKYGLWPLSQINLHEITQNKRNSNSENGISATTSAVKPSTIEFSRVTKDTYPQLRVLLERCE